MHIASISKKGKKAGSLSTPNQDNLFQTQVIVGNSMPVVICGIIDGHGPFGHLASAHTVLRLSRSITSPSALARCLWKLHGRQWGSRLAWPRWSRRRPHSSSPSGRPSRLQTRIRFPLAGGIRPRAAWPVSALRALRLQLGSLRSLGVWWWWIREEMFIGSIAGCGVRRLRGM